MPIKPMPKTRVQYLTTVTPDGLLELQRITAFSYQVKLADGLMFQGDPDRAVELYERKKAEYLPRGVMDFGI